MAAPNQPMLDTLIADIRSIYGSDLKASNHLKLFEKYLTKGDFKEAKTQATLIRKAILDFCGKQRTTFNEKVRKGLQTFIDSSSLTVLPGAELRPRASSRDRDSYVSPSSSECVGCLKRQTEIWKLTDQYKKEIANSEKKLQESRKKLKNMTAVEKEIQKLKDDIERNQYEDGYKVTGNGPMFEDIQSIRSTLNSRQTESKSDKTNMKEIQIEIGKLKDDVKSGQLDAKDPKTKGAVFDDIRQIRQHLKQRENMDRYQMKEEAKKTTTSLNLDDLLLGSDSFSSMDGTQVKHEANNKYTLLNQDDSARGSDSIRSMNGLMEAQLHVSVAALSDANRPTKIAERFSQLYDDVWTDAFQVQADRFKRSEKVAATRLLEMLKDAHQFCVETADLHTNKVLDELLTFGNDSKRNMRSSGKQLHIQVLSETQRKHFHELRRLTVEYTIEHLQDMFFAYITKEKKYDMRESPPYLEKCVELCWYMVLQDPPIHIQFEPTTQPGSPFRPEEYRFYSKSGKKLAYIVWPPLRLKKGGEMLAKGVAQSM